MSSNLRVDRILPSTGTEVGVGTATGSVALYGDVNIAGTLTYEDVTNIDSVGVVTARNGLHVTSGNVGIGENNPTSSLVIKKSNNSGVGPELVLNNSSGSYGDEMSILFSSGGTPRSGLKGGITVDGQGSGWFSLSTRNPSGNYGERIRVTSSGYVGIGLTNPSWHLDIKSTSVNAVVRLKSSGSTNGGQLQVNSDDLILRNRDAGNLQLWTNDTERVRITSDGRLLLGTTDAGGNNTANHLVVSNNAGANDQAGMTIRGGTSGRSQIFFSDGNSGQDEYRGMLRYDHQDNSMQFRTNAVEKFRIISAGDVQARRSRSNTVGDVALSIQPSDSTIHYGFRIDITNNNLNLDRVGSGNITTFRNDGLIFAKALQITDNLTPTSGRGVEIFEASAGVGLIQSFNRTGGSFDELRFRGSEVRLYSGTNLRLDVQNAQSYLYGTSDGVLNISTTDSRGSFIRYQLNGSTKCWAGCSQGLGTSGNQDDFGIRATRDIRFRAGTQTNMRLTAAGYLQVASDSDVTGDNEHIFRQHQTQYNVLQLRAETSSYAASGGGALAVGVIRSASSSYVFGGWYSGNNSSNFQDRKFSFRGDGQGYADGAWNGGGADYAEYFEWSDGNTSSEDRRGISVVLDGDKIREATSGEDPIGVISANPSVVGDADDLQWKNKYLRTEYGSFDLDENGEQKLNPDYNPNQEYVSRENRPEWDCVGLMGKLRIRKGQITGSRWIKMRDVSVNVEEWLVR